MRIHLWTMFNVDFTFRNNTPKIINEHRRVMFVRRFFCKRGTYLKEYKWIDLYRAISDFKLIFKFKYNMTNKSLTADYIPRQFRWFNQMRFFQFYLKLFQRVQWYQLPLKRLFIYINKAKRHCYKGLIQQNK